MLKKLLSLLLAGLLCTGLGMPAFAASDDDDEENDDKYDYYDDDDSLDEIVMSNDSVRMVEGEELRLTVRFYPSSAEEDLDWSTRNEDIATVDNDGNVEAISEGRTTIRAETESGEYATCMVEVRTSNDRYDDIDRVEMNLKEVTVRIGQTRQLMAHISPSNIDPDSDEVDWESDDTSIADVGRDGTVKGIRLGSTVITASAGGKKDTCRVTVVEASAVTGSTTAAASKPAASSSASTVVGTLSSADLRSNVERVAGSTASGKTGTASFADSGVITPELMTTAASAAGGKTVLLRFATTNAATKTRPGYLTLDPKVGRNLKNSINTGVFVSGKEVDAAEATFDKYYQNDTKALYLGQPGGYGMTVTVQAIVDLTGMDTKNLVFYSYADNKVQKLTVDSYSVDQNGFLRFPASVGGVIIVSDGALVK